MASDCYNLIANRAVPFDSKRAIGVTLDRKWLPPRYLSSNTLLTRNTRTPSSIDCRLWWAAPSGFNTGPVSGMAMGRFTPDHLCGNGASLSTAAAVSFRAYSYTRFSTSSGSVWVIRNGTPSVTCFAANCEGALGASWGGRRSGAKTGFGARMSVTVHGDGANIVVRVFAIPPHGCCPAQSATKSLHWAPASGNSAAAGSRVSCMGSYRYNYQGDEFSFCRVNARPKRAGRGALGRSEA